MARAALTAPGPEYRLKVVATGPRMEVFVNGEPMLDIVDATHPSGVVGLRTWKAAAQWDNVTAARLDDPDGLRPETAVAFTVTGAFADEDALAGTPAVKGFTLLDAANRSTETELATVADGATLDLSSSATGAVDIRADAAGRPDANSVVLELRGPREATRRWTRGRRGGCSDPAAAACRTGRTP